MKGLVQSTTQEVIKIFTASEAVTLTHKMQHLEVCVADSIKYPYLKSFGNIENFI